MHVVVLPPHMAALHQQQQQQQQRSRMLGLMQSTAAQNTVNQTQFPPATAPRLPFQGSGAGHTARNLFSTPTESSAANSDSVYYPRPPVCWNVDVHRQSYMWGFTENCWTNWKLAMQFQLNFHRRQKIFFAAVYEFFSKITVHSFANIAVFKITFCK